MPTYCYKYSKGAFLFRDFPIDEAPDMIYIASGVQVFRDEEREKKLDRDRQKISKTEL